MLRMPIELLAMLSHCRLPNMLGWLLFANTGQYMSALQSELHSVHRLGYLREVQSRVLPSDPAQ